MDVYIGDRHFTARDRPVVVGVINTSPESPTRSSVVRGPADALDRAQRLREGGAEIVDVGARSSDYSVPDTSWQEERRRLLPVVEALKAGGFLVSVDSWDAHVIRAAAAAGADLINDGDGLQSPAVITAVATSHLPVVVPFLTGPNPRNLRPFNVEDPMSVMVPWFEAALGRARRAGIEQVLVDPGSGYARPELSDKAHDRFQRLLPPQLPALGVLGHPLFVALPRREQPAASLKLARAIVAAGADFIRTHDADVVTRAASEHAAEHDKSQAGLWG